MKRDWLVRMLALALILALGLPVLAADEDGDGIEDDAPVVSTQIPDSDVRVNGYVITIIGEDLSDLQSVSYGNTTLARDVDYEAASGSVVIRLKPDFYRHLRYGWHELRVDFSSHYAIVFFRVRPNVAAAPAGPEWPEPEEEEYGDAPELPSVNDAPMLAAPNENKNPGTGR